MALVVLPVGGILIVLTVTAINAFAPRLFWPAMVAFTVAIVLPGGSGGLRPYPRRDSAVDGTCKQVVEMLRASGFRMVGLVLLMLLGLFSFTALGQWIEPYVRPLLHKQ